MPVTTLPSVSSIISAWYWSEMIFDGQRIDSRMSRRLNRLVRVVSPGRRPCPIAPKRWHPRTQLLVHRPARLWPIRSSHLSCASRAAARARPAVRPAPARAGRSGESGPNSDRDGDRGAASGLDNDIGTSRTLEFSSFPVFQFSVSSFQFPVSRTSHLATGNWLTLTGQPAPDQPRCHRRDLLLDDRGPGSGCRIDPDYRTTRSRTNGSGVPRLSRAPASLQRGHAFWRCAGRDLRSPA